MKNNVKYFCVVLVLWINGMLASCSTTPSDIDEDSETPIKTSSTEQPQNKEVQQEPEKGSSRVIDKKIPSRVQTESSIANDVNSLALDLYIQLSKQSPKNLFLSPYSIFSALAILYKGAKGNTQQQMSKVFHFDQDVSKKIEDFERQLAIQDKDAFYQFHLVNEIYMQKGLSVQADYLYFLIDHYNNKRIQLVDFKINPEKLRQDINDRIKQNTQEKITELLPSGTISKETKLVLANAIYFRGGWQALFDEKQTKEASFHVASHQEIKVPTMFQKHRVNYFEDEEVQCIELPYKGRRSEQGELSMVILLPKDVNKLKQIEKKLNDWFAPQFKKQLVAIHLPKFTTESNFELINALKELGMTDAFERQKADLTGINEGLFVSTIAHQALVEVDEKGTEASAGTAVVAIERGIPPKAKEFRADHPFIFWIKENFSNTILFLGRVVEPKI